MQGLKTSLPFLCLLAVFSLMRWGMMTAAPGVEIDMLLILAVLASLIGGLPAAVFSGAVWALCRAGAYGLSLPLLFVLESLPLIFAVSVYTDIKKNTLRAADAPYWALGACGIARSGLWLALAYIGLGQPADFGAERALFLHFLVETGFALLMLKLVLGQLRKHHILNGIKSQGTQKQSN